MRDLVVVGGGPAGLATAIEAARSGMRVSVMERQQGVIDKACGEGLMPGAWDDLRALGVSEQLGHRLAGIRYVRADRSAEAAFRTPGRGVRRVHLHEAMLRRADELGVERVRATVTELAQHDDHVTVQGVDARWCVAADGLRSPIRAHLGLERPARWPARYGVRRHYAMRPWTSHVEVHWADDAEAYVTPVGDDLVGVAFLFGAAAHRSIRGESGTPFDKMLRRFPSLLSRVHTPTSAVRGAGPFARRAAARRAHRVLLVGDAAGYLDPLTGEGLKLGVRGARAAVAALIAGRPEAYERAWRRLYRPYAWATGGLLIATTPRWSRRWVLPAVQSAPGLMRAVVSVLSR